MDSLELSPLWVSIFTSTILGVITLFYLRETRRISIEAQRPSLGIEPTLFDLSGLFGALKLRNTGALAKNLSIDISNPKGDEKWYVPSLSRDMSVRIFSQSIEEMQKNGTTLSVKVCYQDSASKKLSVDFTIDFAKLKTEVRKIVYQSDSLEEIVEKLRMIEQYLSLSRLR